MNYNELNDKLKQLDIEDFIWVIYIGIIIMSWYSNSLERKYYINNDTVSKEKYRKIITFIFLILIVGYVYFLKSSVDDIKKLKPNDSLRKRNLVYLSFVGSLLIFISGVIFLYISIADDDLSVEIAFN